MINHSVKKNIRLLAEKYDYAITYEQEVVVLERDDISIRLTTIDKYSSNVKYTNKDTAGEINITPQFVFHAILMLFDYENNYSLLNWKFNELLTLEHYYREENFSEKEISAWIYRLKETNTDYEMFPGNHIGIEYYKGILILTDNIYFYSWNVVEWV